MGRSWMSLIAGLALALAGCSSAPALAPEHAPEPSASPAVPSPAAAPFVTGLTIPWAVGGERMRRDGTRGNDPGEWPPFPVQAIRLWDAHLSQAERERVDHVTLVLAGAPGDLEQWREYVRTVATRYRGRIDAYEIGNEPNLRTFWNGTPQEFAELVQVAATEIRAADPQATIAVNAGLIRRPDDLPALATWLGAALGKADGQGADVDVVTVHVYPSVAQVGRVIDLLGATRQQLEAITDRPAWVTEMNVRDGSSLPPDEQQRVVEDLPRAVEAAGFDRAYWYAWTDLGPAGLIQFAPGTPGAKALRAGSRTQQG